MTHPTKMLPLTLVAAIVLQLPLVSIASAQQTSPGVVAKQTRARTLYQSMDMLPNGAVWSQSAARAAHPITQGGTTGGTAITAADLLIQAAPLSSIQSGLT
jgi:hypothetical protein